MRRRPWLQKHLSGFVCCASLLGGWNGAEWGGGGNDVLLDRIRDEWHMTRHFFEILVEPSKYDELQDVLDRSKHGEAKTSAESIGFAGPMTRGTYGCPKSIFFYRRK